MPWLRAHRWGVGLALAVALMFAAYSIAANAWWVGDDYNYVVPKSWDTVLHFFDPIGRAQWRPLNWITWALDWDLFGPQPLGWHLTGFLMHAVNIVSAGLLVRAITGRSDVALLAAALFGVHPASPAAVTWIGGRNDVSFALPWLPALWLWVRWRQGAGRGTWALAVLLGALSILGKEAAITLPLASLWIDLVFGRAWARWPGRRDAGWWRDGRTWLLLLRDHAPFLLISIGYGAFRLGLYAAGLGRLMYGADEQLGFFARAPQVLAGYLVLALGPWWLPDQIIAWPAAATWAVIGAGALALALLMRWVGRLAVFAVGWMAITLLLTTQAVASRWFYIPALGVGLLIAAVWAQLWGGAARRAAVGDRQGAAWRRGLAAGPLLLLVLWSGLTWVHNDRWREAGEVARAILAQVRVQIPDPPRPATFYVDNPPYSYRSVLLFNSGFKAAMQLLYGDWTTIKSYDLSEDAGQVRKALADPAQLGPHPLFVGYVPDSTPAGGRIVIYPSLPALVAAQR